MTLIPTGDESILNFIIFKCFLHTIIFQFIFYNLLCKVKLLITFNCKEFLDLLKFLSALNFQFVANIEFIG